MAEYYPCIIVALLMCYSHTTGATSKCTSNIALIKRHLLKEKELPNLLRDVKDEVYSLNDDEKQELCDEVARQLIGNKLGSLLGKGDLEEPRIAKQCPPFAPRKVRVEGMEMSKFMYWCEPRQYEEMVTGQRGSATTSKSNIGQIEGFFCAGSLTKGYRVYVFRPQDADAEEVVPVVELDKWSPWGSSSSSECSSDNASDVAKESEDGIIFVE